MDECIFCKIINGGIPSTKVFENEYVYAFKDINPVAPVHIIIVPKAHITCADDVKEDNSIYISKIFEAIPAIAISENLSNGYRIINNCKEDGGQTVNHLHFHLIGGKKLGEKII